MQCFIKNDGGEFLRDRLSVVDEVDQHDGVRVILEAFLEKKLDLLHGVVVSDARVDHLDVLATVGVEMFEPLGEGLLEGNTPTNGDRVSEKHDAAHARGAFIGKLPVPQTLRVGFEVNAHEVGRTIGAVLMPNQRIGRNLLYVPGVFPHLKVELQTIVGNHSDVGLNPDADDRRGHCRG